MAFLRNKFLWLFALGMLIFTGCNLLSDAGKYSSSDSLPQTSELILSRDLSSQQAFYCDTPEFKLRIDANSLDQDVHLNLFKIPPYLETFPWHGQFKQISGMYQSEILPEVGVLRYTASMTFVLPGQSSPDKKYFAAIRSKNGTWQLLAPNSIGQNFISFAINSFSDWVLVEPTSLFAGSLAEAPVITASPTVVVAATTGEFESDLEISITIVETDGASSQSPAKREVKIAAIKPCKITLKSIDGTAGQDLTSDITNSITVNLLDSRLVQTVSSRNTATHTFRISLSDKLFSEMPDFLVFTAQYSLPEGLGFTANQTVFFRKKSLPTEFKIVSFSPADGMTNAPISQVVEFKFSNSVDKNTLSAAYSPLPIGGYTANWSDNDTLLRLSPVDKLAYNHNYQITVNAATRDIYGLSLDQSSTISLTTVAAVKPIIESTAPVTGSTNVVLDQQFRFYFSKPMSPDSVSNAFSISPAANGATSLLWQDKGKTLVLNFSEPLSPATFYQIKMAATATDIDGLQLANPYLLSFTTLTKPHVLISKSFPAADSTEIAINTAIKAWFSNTMNPASAQAAFRLTPEGQSTPLSGSFFWSDNLMTFTPNSSLLYNTGYRITIASTATDISGNSIDEPASWQFKTRTSMGQITELSPASGSSSISVKSLFVIKFNLAMNTALTAAAVTLEPALAGGADFFWSAGNSILNLVPRQNLQYATSYRLKVASSARSANGEALQNEYIIAYSTATQTKVLKSLPANAQTSVNTNAAIEVFFSRNIISASLLDRFKVSSGTTAIPGNLNVIENRAIFVPAVPLPFSSNIAIEVLSGVLDSEALPVQLPFSSIFTTAAGTTPEFKIASYSPADGAINSPLNQVVEFRFSNPVDKNSLSVTYSPVLASGYTTTWSDNDKFLQLSPVAKLAYSHNYQVTVNAATRDIYGLLLDQSSTISFSTIAAVKPVILSSTPSVDSINIALDQQFKIYFSKQMNKGSVASAFSISPAASGTPSLSWENTDRTLVLTFSEPLSHATFYQIKIGATAADVEGAQLASTYLLSFTTLAKPQVLFNNSYPTADSTGIAIANAVKVAFSKTMNLTSAQAAFALIPDGESTPLSGSFSWSGDIMTFTPAVSLLNNTVYRVLVDTTATDISGNSLNTPASWQFKTETAVVAYARITELSPASGSSFISVKSGFLMKFDLAMNTALTAGAVTFEPALTGGANFFWSAGNSILNVVPLQNLQFATDYRLKVASSASSVNGEALQADYIIVYSTATQTKVLDSLPANTQTGVPATASIEVIFSRNINAATLNDRFKVNSGTVTIPGTITVNDNRAVFVPTAPMPESSNITINVLTGVLDSVGLPIQLPFSSGFTTASAQPPEFKITSSSPADGATNSPVNQGVEFRFSSSVDKNSLSITYSPVPVGGYTTSWSDRDTLLRVSPVGNLAYSHNYQVTVNATTRDVYASPLVQGSTISFTTIAAVKPAVASTTPAVGSVNVALDQQFRIYFSKQMNKSSVANAFSISPAANGIASLTWENTDKTLLISFSAPLNHATLYQMQIGSAAADIEGLQLTNAYLLSFATLEKPQVLLTNSYPTGGSTDLAITTAIKIGFSKTMNPASAQAAFALTPDGTSTPLSGSFSWNGDIMNFTPANSLLYDTVYQVMVATTATDIYGNSLNTAATWQFKTGIAGIAYAHITELSPASDSSYISAKSGFIIKFDLAMNTGLTGDAVTFEPALTGGANFAWSSGTSILNLVPLQNLQFATDYRLKVASSARGINGEPLHADYIIAYSTASQTKILNSLPANAQTGVTTNAAIEVIFSRNISAISLNERFKVSSGTVAITGALTVTDNRAVFVPATLLPYSSNIAIEVLNGVLDSEGLPVQLPFSSTFTTAAAPAPEFKISGSAPADGMTNSPISQVVEFRFSNPVDRNSLSVTYSPAPAGGYTTSWSDSDTVLRLSPADKLEYSHNYQITINTATRDVNGSSLTQGSTISFTTVAAVKPVVISTTPSAGSVNVALDQQFKIDFSKQMNQSSVASALSISPVSNGATSLTWEDNDRTLILSFSEPLSHSTSYQIRIGATAADIEGLQLTNIYLLSFTTLAKPQVLLSSSYPTADSTGLAITTAVKIGFSKTMNQASAQAAFAMIADGESTPLNGSFSWSGDFMTFTPAISLLYNTIHRITVATTATDISGNSLSAPASWQFKTAANEGQVWRLDQAQTDAATTFSPRKGHVMINFNNKLWVIGGQSTTFLNDIWSSTDGIAWTKEVADGSAGMFTGRAGHACVVFNNRIWLTGGYAEPGDVATWFDDVWSTVDGKTWVLEVASAEYYSRAWHNMAVYNNKLWMISGETVDGNGNPVLLDDSWSSNDGKTWQLRSNIVSFFPRKQAASGVINGKLWVWGGYGENAEGIIGPLNDVWSTTNGDSWVYEKAHANFGPRCGAGQTLFNGRIWITGGANQPDSIGALCYNDVWASNDGLNWIEILGNSAGAATQFSPRAWQQISPLGERLILSGGENITQILNEVWSTK